MRPFFLACFLIAASCRPTEDVPVSPAPREIVEVALGDSGDRLVWRLPDEGWVRVEEAGFRGFLYARGERTLRVRIALDAREHAARVEEARADGGEVRSMPVGRGWPYVGAVVTYRGPPDAALLDAFAGSFRVERR